MDGIAVCDKDFGGVLSSVCSFAESHGCAPGRKSGPVLEMAEALLARGTCDVWSLLCLLSTFCVPVLLLN